MNAVEIAGHGPGPFLFTCEHARNALPPGITASSQDQAWLADHWGWDIGARDVALALVDALGGQAVLTAYSRLWCDANRDPADPSFIVCTIDGLPVTFNQALSAAQVRERIEQVFAPYHAAVDETLRAALAHGPVHLLAVHSFTPLYAGVLRPMEVGVLFDDFDADAGRLAGALGAQGFAVALNEPYSGKPPQGLIYAARRHGRSHGVKYLELEIRQDLIDSAVRARAVAQRIAAALDCFRPGRAAAP
jgi:predicted N-formylglutamate amidohydrolase